MPTKRRVFLFLIVLAVMLLIKRAVAQEAWPPVSDGGWYGQETSLLEDIFGTMCMGFAFGTLSGLFRATERHFAAVRGNYFSGDLVTLHIRN